ncbi:DNA-binding death effector domain-containing protein isoform 1 [Schistosoma japonicum]|uniref:DNA-binding death effector domain-containing protein isoform 1 n=1 Tax=Schistosoma japonicum TaxID=6182 RepID=A0A4Z2CR15_SCHJA|nr:DNA-binding death effector domain-containing protein isoform 1 [Schistosoma japonicum]
MSSTQNAGSEPDPRYCRLWKCQVSIGELYRWILAKLSDKDIKRALHKYRDLMPRQSDWNRKLTQATSMPELGFRYLYRCGQIDESNHRTMQKMLKYIDRQDVLPYFDTILYNTNHSNCSLEELQKVLLDRVNVFLEYSSVLHEEEVHPEPPYEKIRRQPLESSRVTRLSMKRKSSVVVSTCNVTSVKRGRRSINCSPSETGKVNDFENSPLRCCNKVRSAILANSLNGPVVHTMLSASLISMLASLHTTLSQTFDNPSLSLILNTLSNDPTGACVNNPNSPAAKNPLTFHLLAIIPQLIAASRTANQLSNPNLLPNPVLPHQVSTISNNINNNNNNNNHAGIFGPRFIGMHNRPMVNVDRHLPQQAQEHADPAAPVVLDVNVNHGHNVQDPVHPVVPGFRVPFINPPNVEGDRPGGLLFAPQPNIRLADSGSPSVVSQHSTNPPLLLKHVVLSSGGIGITSSTHDSVIHYYCNIKLHVNIDFGPSTESLRRIQTVRQDFFERQIDFFVQASNLLKARSPNEFVCNLQFTRLNQLEDFWADYQSGALRHYLMSSLKSGTNRSFFGEPPQSIPPLSSSVVSEQPPDIPDAVRQNPVASPVDNEGRGGGGNIPITLRPNSTSQNSTENNPNIVSSSSGEVPPNSNVSVMNSNHSLIHSASNSASPSLNMVQEENSLNMLASSIEALSRTFQRLRRREFTNTSLSSEQSNEFSKFELNLFVSRREYENGRCLLMRNLRYIPSLCQLVSTSSIIIPDTVNSISTTSP